MSKLSSLEQKAPGGAIKTVGTTPDTTTHQGGRGFSRDAKSELFLLATTNMVGEDTFYEAATERDRRYIDLIHQVAVEDPDWLARFVPYLRNTMNMRSASVVMAAETVHAKLTRPVPSSTVANRTIIDAALMRPDEPAEMIGYWRHRYGRNLPMPVKRGIADAVTRLYSERSLIKYDGQAQALRFADVIDIVHPEPKAPWQSTLFKYALADRHKREMTLPWDSESPYASLKTIQAYRNVLLMEREDLRALFSPELVASAALTWETASSKYGPLDAKFWEAMVPHLGIFALVRNLRNIGTAGVREATLDDIRRRLTDPEEIAKSRMFPLRFYAAYRETGDFTFARELETAITLSLANVPTLPGRTIILIDVSGSMVSPVGGKRATLMRWEAAAVFGTALGKRAEHASVYLFESTLKTELDAKHAAILRAVEAVKSQIGGGTDITGAVANAYAKHPDAARIVILTDEQQGGFGLPAGHYLGGFTVWGNVGPQTDPKAIGSIKVPIYTFNLAGYRAGALPSGEDKRYTFGGLTDAAFSMLPQLEAGRDAGWPF